LHTFSSIGSLADAVNDTEKAIYSYDNALRYNPYNVRALTQIAACHRAKEQYTKVCSKAQWVVLAIFNTLCVFFHFSHKLKKQQQKTTAATTKRLLTTTTVH